MPMNWPPKTSPPIETETGGRTEVVEEGRVRNEKWELEGGRCTPRQSFNNFLCMGLGMGLDLRDLRVTGMG